jgi:hypothetical protein
MGMKYNHLREECESSKEEKEEEICMGKEGSFYRRFWGQQEGSRVLDLGGNNGGHVSSCLELLKVEEASCQACRRGRLSGL